MASILSEQEHAKVLVVVLEWVWPCGGRMAKPVVRGHDPEAGWHRREPRYGGAEPLKGTSG